MFQTSRFPARFLLCSLMAKSEMLTRGKMKETKQYEYDKLSIKDKRRLYACGDNYETLEKIPTWPLFAKVKHIKPDDKAEVECDQNLNDKIGVYLSDITRLEIDVIVNAANSSLMAGGGVCGKIHGAAGHGLQQECDKIGSCGTGSAVLTKGYKLPARYVIHAVGPMGEHPEELSSAYKKCLDLMKDNQLRSIAFPCISTGIYGYPSDSAGPVAIRTVRKWLEDPKNRVAVDRIIFCLFTQKDISTYTEWLPKWFPLPTTSSEDGAREALNSQI